MHVFGRIKIGFRISDIDVDEVIEEFKILVLAKRLRGLRRLQIVSTAITGLKVLVLKWGKKWRKERNF